MRETFPEKRAGDDLTAEHINNLSRVARRISGQGAGSYGANIDGQTLQPPPHIQRILRITAKKETGDTTWECDEALYQGQPRYYDHDLKMWVTDVEDGPYCIDTSEFSDDLNVGDIVQAWWDHQRDMFVGGPLSDTGGTSTSTGCTCCNPWNCVDPGLRIEPDCPICRCGIDPWYLQSSVIKCGDSSVGGARPLFLSPDDSSATECYWKSEEFDSEGRTFQWVLHIEDDLTATLTLFEVFAEASSLMARWFTDDFCCKCENTFVARCPTYFPIPCTGLPERICLVPPLTGIPRTCPIEDCCLEGYAKYFQFISDSFGSTGLCCPEINSAREWPFDVGLSSKPGYRILRPDPDVDCGWYSNTPQTYPNVSACMHMTLGTKGSPDFCVFVLFITDTGGNKARYEGTLNCDEDSTLSLISNTLTCDSVPATIVLRPARVLVDSDGNEILDGSGNPILLDSYDECSTGTCICCGQVVWANPPTNTVKGFCYATNPDCPDALSSSTCQGSDLSDCLNDNSAGCFADYINNVMPDDPIGTIFCCEWSEHD